MSCAGCHSLGYHKAQRMPTPLHIHTHAHVTTLPLPLSLFLVFIGCRQCHSLANSYYKGLGLATHACSCLFPAKLPVSHNASSQASIIVRNPSQLRRHFIVPLSMSVSGFTSISAIGLGHHLSASQHPIASVSKLKALPSLSLSLSSKKNTRV